MALDTELRFAREGATRWDWWPLARLLTVLGAFGTLACLSGYSLDFASLRGLPGRVFEVFTFLTLLSFALAHLYLMLLMFPLYAAVTLNDSFYDLSHWVARKAFGVRSCRLLATLGLIGEVALFWALIWIVRQSVIRCL